MVSGAIIMNLKRINYAAHNAAGFIVGLYNSVDHRDHEIPLSRIHITQQQHSEIVRRPQDFSVDTNTNQLVDSKRNKNVSLEHIDSEVNEIQKRISAGFMYKDVCYWADDRASDHITQSLAILAVDKDFKPVLKVTVDGEVDYVSVSRNDLIEIAKGVNALRIGL